MTSKQLQDKPASPQNGRSNILDVLMNQDNNGGNDKSNDDQIADPIKYTQPGPVDTMILEALGTQYIGDKKLSSYIGQCKTQEDLISLIIMNWFLGKYTDQEQKKYALSIAENDIMFGRFKTGVNYMITDLYGHLSDKEKKSMMTEAIKQIGKTKEQSEKKPNFYVNYCNTIDVVVLPIGDNQDYIYVDGITDKKNPYLGDFGLGANIVIHNATGSEKDLDSILSSVSTIVKNKTPEPYYMNFKEKFFDKDSFYDFGTLFGCLITGIITFAVQFPASVMAFGLYGIGAAGVAALAVNSPILVPGLFKKIGRSIERSHYQSLSYHLEQGKKLYTTVQKDEDIAEVNAKGKDMDSSYKKTRLGVIERAMKSLVEYTESNKTSIPESYAQAYYQKTTADNMEIMNK